MKKFVMCIFPLLWGTLGIGQPIRVALLDFENQIGSTPDERLGGDIHPARLTQKGVYLAGKHLLEGEGYVLIDRRDFIHRIEQLPLKDGDQLTPTRPSFLHAAQALRADAVLRGALLSFSTGKNVVNQGGFHTDFSTLSLRVMLEALDATDGAVLALAEGVAKSTYRQTEELQTVLSENDVLELMEHAVAQAVKEVRQELGKKMTQQRARPKAKLSVMTTEDPAFVEIDGILVGSTPLDNFEIYQGDHVLTIGKPGYRDITKRILFEKDTRIEAPMFRVELTADELKEILEQSRIHAFIGAEPALVIETIESR